MNRMLAVLVACGACATAAQAVVVGVNPGGPWLGFMNVFDLPSNGGGYVFGSPWGTADLCATFSGSVLKLSPNSINDPSPFWYTPSGGPGSTGNKIMEANFYQEVTGAYAGQTLTFEGNVLSNSLTSDHVARIFIRDFAADYSSSVDTFINVTPGNFSISLNTINDPARHVQWGFQVKGPCVWITDVAQYGFAEITEIPAPSAMALVGLGGIIAGRRRRA
ncbi:MAG: PEP-CTERM sorting domain-containing protein [Phycisphaerales bacterium]